MIKSQKLNALICLIIILISCKSNTTKNNLYEVECNADGIYNGVRAYLKSSNNNKQVIDTAVVMNGAFKFKGEVSSPEMRILTIDGINGQTALVLESGKTNVTIYKDSIYKSIIKGGENNSIFNKYKDGYQNLVEKVTSLREEYMASRNNIEAVKRIQKQNVELRLELKNYGLNFLIQHPDTDFSLMLLESITLQKEFDAKLANEILEKEKLRKKKTNFRLKDWGISRQRYWGCPIPIAYDENNEIVKIPIKELPVKLPEKINLNTKGNPLDNHADWKHVNINGKNCIRETDTLDTFVDSSWYFLRFCSAKKSELPFQILGHRFSRL